MKKGTLKIAFLTIIPFAAALSSCSFSDAINKFNDVFGNNYETDSEAKAKIDSAIANGESNVTVWVGGASDEKAVSLATTSPAYDREYVSVSYAAGQRMISYSFEYKTGSISENRSDWKRDESREIADVTFTSNVPLDEWKTFPTDGRAKKLKATTGEQLVKMCESDYSPVPVPNSDAERLYAKAKDIISKNIPFSSKNAEKAALAYSYIGRTSEYDIDIVKKTLSDPLAWRSHRLEGPMEDGVGVCDGFAREYSLLLNTMGIKCERISGVGSDGVGHMWDEVSIDGEWHMADPTNSNASVNGTGSATLWNDFLAEPDRLASEYQLRDGYTFPKGDSAYDFYGMSGSVVSDYQDVVKSLEKLPSDGRSSVQIKPSYDDPDGSKTGLMVQTAVDQVGLDGVAKLWDKTSKVMTLFRGV